jgi:hypothetical protein
MSHLPLLLIIVLVIVGIAVVAVLKSKLARVSPTDDASGGYQLRLGLLTPAERSFAGVLDGALPEGLTWFAKVRLGDVFQPREGLARSASASASNRINQKHFDFLLVRTTDFGPVAGIELDDKSHQRARRKERDAFVDDVCQMCHLPLLHQPAQAAYDQAQLRATISALVAKPYPAMVTR